MDRWTTLAISILLAVVADRKEARKVYPALAKIYVKIHMLAQLDQNLQVEIERQEAKAGGK